MKTIENSTGTFTIDHGGCLVNYVPNLRNTGSQSRSVFHLELPEGIWVLPENAFRGYDVLHDLTVPQSLERIEQGAFFGAHLDRLRLPFFPKRKILEQLAHRLRFVHTWSGTALMKGFPRWCVDIYEGKGEDLTGRQRLINDSGAFLVDSDGILMDFEPDPGNLVSQKDYGMTVRTLHVPSGVKAISGGMFQQLEVLDSMTLPETLRAIGLGCGHGNVFNSAKLPDAQLPESLEALGNFTFGCCTFRSLTITGASAYMTPCIRRQFKDSKVGTLRVPAKYRDLLEKFCHDWGWGEITEVTDPKLGALATVSSLEDTRRADRIAELLASIAGRGEETKHG